MFWPDVAVRHQLTAHYTPITFRQLWIAVIMAILVIIAVYVWLIVLSHLQNLVDTNKVLQSYDPIWLDDLLLLIVDLVFGLCDILFVRKWI